MTCSWHPGLTEPNACALKVVFSTQLIQICHDELSCQRLMQQGFGQTAAVGLGSN